MIWPGTTNASRSRVTAGNIGHPALADETGVVAVPPPVPDPLPRIALGLGIGLLLAAALRKSSRPAG